MRGRPAAEGVAGAHVDRRSRDRSDPTRLTQPGGTRPRRRRRVKRHLHREGGPIRRRDAEGPADPTGSRPSGAGGARVAGRPAACTSSLGRRHRSRGARALRSTTSAATRAGRRESRWRGRSAVCAIGAPARGRPAGRAHRGARRDDHFIQMRVVDDDRRRGRLDDIAEMRVRKSAAQRVNRRGGEHDVTNLPQAD